MLDLGQSESRRGGWWWKDHSRKARVLSDSKTFMDGMSPVERCQRKEGKLWCWQEDQPFMILQKMQLAAILSVDMYGSGQEAT